MSGVQRTLERKRCTACYAPVFEYAMTDGGALCKPCWQYSQGIPICRHCNLTLHRDTAGQWVHDDPKRKHPAVLLVRD